ncbi:MAG: YtxH domain-containing protein [Parachlamydiaceae bacterium]|nr:YtxH domain-containing protein [Parachlamydiaceae bacterium]
MNTEEKFILGALVGTALGAAAALIFTPMTGKNLRTKLLNGLSQGQTSPKRRSSNRTSSHMARGHDSEENRTANTHPAKSKTSKSDDLAKKARAKKKVSE